ncbi:MAG: FAD-binding oxidoreductase [Myxococcales bacterium]|nr:FAD-binding oxidoreductase [Myxococcales bacterium]
MRARSHWGWGYADRFPDAEGQAALAAQVGQVLGLPAGALARPVPLDHVAVPTPRVDVPASLGVPCARDPATRARHTYGRSFPDQVRAFGGDFAPAPDAVARPRDEREVEALLEWASGAGVALVPFGGGTSVVGGVECDGARHAGVVTLDLGALNAVLEVDDVSRLARIQAGALGPAIEAGLAPHGLTLRHFPQSFEFSTLGGWIATRAGGHFATLYTHIDDLVAGLRMITPGAGVYATRRLPGSGAGPSPDRLALGSEGTLGVITEAWMRVRPRPRWRASVAAHFTDFEAAVAATRALAQSGLYPSNCRLLDRREAALNQVAFDGTDVLLVGFESADHPLDAPMRRAVELLRDHGGALPRPPTLRDAGAAGRDATAGQWRAAFLDAPYLQSTLLSLGYVVDTFETACTWQDFPALHAEIVDRVRGAMKAHCGGGRLSLRFTHVYPDGPAPYYTFIAPGADLPPGADRRYAQLERWAAVKRAASEALIAHGATITHHHAVGRVHRPWYDRQRSGAFAAALRGAKDALDPAGVMNPGVLLDPA